MRFVQTSNAVDRPTHFGYKKCFGEDYKVVIVQLEISGNENNEMRPNVKFKNRNYASYRCKRAIVTRICNLYDSTKYLRAYSWGSNENQLEYILKQEVVSPYYDEKEDVVDGAGIHYFLCEDAAYWYAMPPVLVWRTYYTNGQVAKINDLKLGGGLGTCTHYYPSGQLEYVGNFKGDALHGLSTLYYENGCIESEVEYVDGNACGEYRNYYDNGQLNEVCFYNKGKLDGNFEQFYENGNPKVVGVYKCSKYVGWWCRFYENKQVMENGNFVNGLRHSEWRKYHQSGLIDTRYIYYYGNITYKSTSTMDVDEN